MIKRAIVTGASGMIGRRLIRRLIDKGVSTVAVDSQQDEHGCQFLLRDLVEAGSLDSVVTPGCCIFHLAARADVSRSVTDPLGDFQINVGATINVLEAARRSGASVVFTSSAAVFDPQSPLPHQERAPKRPVSPYGTAKLAGEHYVATYHRCYGLNAKTVRLFNVYAEHMSRFAIADFIRKIQQADDEIDILGDGCQIRDYLHADDAVEGIIRVAERGVPGEDYNLASGEPTRLSELAQTIAHLMDKPHLRIRVTGQSFAGDIQGWYADVSKIRSIGFTPMIPLEEGLKRVIRSLSGSMNYTACTVQNDTN
jgi:UDP-glucose 4-epimerase